MLKVKIKKQIIYSIILKIISTFLAFSLSIVLARLLGGEEFGKYTLIISIATVLSMPLCLGIGDLLVREISKNIKVKKQIVKDIVNWALMRILTIIFVIIVLFVLFLYIGTEQNEKNALLHYCVALIPLLALSSYRDSILKGLDFVILGQTSERLLKPLILIITVLVLIDNEIHLTTAKVLQINVILTMILLSLGLVFIYKKRIIKYKRCIDISRENYWKKSVIPLTLISGVQIINSQIDILLIGFILDYKDVSYYKIALTASTLIAFALQAVNVVMSPKYSRIYKNNDIKKLQYYVKLSSRISFMVSLPIFVAVFLYGEYFLVYFYGAEYNKSYTSLLLMSIGQVVNVFIGCVVVLLNMTGHEKETLKVLLTTTLLNLILNIVLIPEFGIEGAAFSTLITMLLWNIILNQKVKKILNIQTRAF